MTLTISLFGSFQASLNDNLISKFRSNRVQALLIYLAVENAGIPHQRDRLLDFLWPGMPQKSAQNNLRQTIYQLRQAIPDNNGIPFIFTGRKTIQRNPDYPLECDVIRFEALLAQSPEVRDEAVALYRGDFLEDFYLPDAGTFEEWAARHRTAYRNLLFDAYEKLIDQHIEDGRLDTAARHARKQLQFDNLREAAHRQLIEVLARSGKRDEAVRQYEACVEILQNELGIPPGKLLTTLYDQILSDQPPSLEKVEPASSGSLTLKLGVAGRSEAVARARVLGLAAEPTSPRTSNSNVPTPATPFVGREVELQALGALMLEPHLRLVTILGPGGMGKTRLALAIARHQADRRAPGSDRLLFPDGVWYASLIPIETAAQFIPAVAEALDLELQPVAAGQQSPEKQLNGFLRRKRLLLLLDNFEHLPEAAPLLAQIMKAAPEVKVLVTSRQRLQLQGEQLFWIQGLELPEEDSGARAAGKGAVRLFADTARRVKPAFSLEGDEVTTVVRICRLLEGMPLAIELAASWATVLSPAAIEREVRRGLEILAGELRDTPERHRSMRATLETSWQRLSEAERIVLRRLSVFRSGFTWEAAQKVTGATLPMLATFANTSWLRHELEQDRYHIHELLRQFGESQLRKEPDDWRSVRDRHAAYYSAFLQQRESRWANDQQRQLLREIHHEADNVRRGWAWATEQGDVTLMAAGLHSLCAYYERRGYESEACQLLSAASDALIRSSVNADGASKDAVRSRLLVRILSWRSRFAASVEEGLAVLTQAETVLEELRRQGLDVRREESLVALWRGNTVMWLSPLVAGPYLKRSLTLSRELEDIAGEALALTGLGDVEWNLGNLEQAAEMVRQGLAAHKAAGNRSGVARTLQSLGLIEKHRGRLVEAQQAHRESYKLLREFGNRHGAASVAAILTMTLVWSGEFEDARSAALEGLQMAEEGASPDSIAGGLSAAAWAHIHLGRYDEALALEERALRLHRETGNRQALGFSLMHLGQLSLARGVYEEAIGRFEEAATLLTEYSKNTRMLPLVLQALALHRSGERARAGRVLRQALRENMTRRVFFVVVNALPAAMQLVAAEGDVQRALELSALASRYPYVANSRWFADVVAADVDDWTAALAPDIVSAALARGQARDLWETAEELIVEFSGDSV